MDDVERAKSFQSEATDVELWIHDQNRKKKSHEYMADELLKSWEKGLLSLAAKYIVAQFCIFNGFKSSFVRVVRNDLKSGRPTPWGIFHSFLSTELGATPKELTDAILAGASRDEDLLRLATYALFHQDADPRWPKIVEGELTARRKDAQKRKEKILKEIKIFRAERMEAELAAAIKLLLQLFPDHSEARQIERKIKDQSLEHRLDELRHFYAKKKEKSLVEIHESNQWPEISDTLAELKKELNLEQSYHLSIALSQMGLYKQALEVLRWHDAAVWTLRETIFECELLVHSGFFVEALSSAHGILSRFSENDGAVREALYWSARSYFGLGDKEQAVEILKGLLTGNAQFRDVGVLLAQWTS